MGYPRANTIAAQAPGFYHCISRCVRRAWLCGDDPLSGRNFDHRRGWIEQRLLTLANSFAVGLYAWAVMSNHTHVVLRMDPQLPEQWSDEEVAFRWARLNRLLQEVPAQFVAERARRLLNQPEQLVEIRRRLGSLSWFMRFLNESIAREANAEDCCTGRFWEGRFKCQALLDEAAVLACMTYVDLNPIRAGIADDLEHSDFTTIQRRLRALTGHPDADPRPLEAVAGVGNNHLDFSVRAYVDLVTATAQITKPNGHGTLSAYAPVLKPIRGSPDWWVGCVARIEDVFGSVVGVPATLRAHAERTGRRCLRGAGVAS